MTQRARTLAAAVIGALGVWWLSRAPQHPPAQLSPLVAVAHADEVSHPRPGAPGAWRLIGRTQADYAVDHDTIIVRGPHDNFRRLKFMVSDAPLRMHTLLVTYDNGVPDRIEVRENIPQGGESRAIDLRGVGRRSIRKVEFWYDSKGLMRGKAAVTLFGMK